VNTPREQDRSDVAAVRSGAAISPRVPGAPMVSPPAGRLLRRSVVYA